MWGSSRAACTGGRGCEFDSAVARGLGRGAGEDAGAARRRELGGGDVARVAGGGDDLLDWPAEPVGRHLRGDGLMALALRRRADPKLRGAVLVDPQPCRLAAPERGPLHPARTAQTDQTSVFAFDAG